MSSHDDQVAVLLPRDVEDLLGSTPLDEDGLHRDPAVVGNEMGKPAVQALMEVAGKGDRHSQLPVINRRLDHVQKEKPRLVITS
jgi:hypothetical protein